MSIFRKWEDDSKYQEFFSLKNNLYSCLSFLSNFVFEYNYYKEIENSFELIRKEKKITNKNFLLLKVLPLVFFRHHRFYNSEIVDFLTSRISILSSEKKELEECFIFFTIIFFLYSGSSVETALSICDEKINSFNDQNIFREKKNVLTIKNMNIDSIKQIENETELILTATLWSILNDVKDKEIDNIFGDKSSYILIIVNAMNGLININDNLDFDKLEKKNKFIKKFYKYCEKQYI